MQYTGFIPRDSAVTALLESAGSTEFADPFLNDPDLNEKIMLNHFVPGYQYAADLVDGVTLTTLGGLEVNIMTIDGKGR